MTQQKPSWLLIAFVANFLVIGVPYWRGPYREVRLSTTLTGPALPVVGVASLVLCARGASGFWTAVIVAGAAVPAAVLARVSVDTQRDPASHNLWPFEVMIALVVGLFPALGGAIVGRILARLTNAPTARPGSDRA
jgi:hypothetical protein